MGIFDSNKMRLAGIYLIALTCVLLIGCESKKAEKSLSTVIITTQNSRHVHYFNKNNMDTFEGIILSAVEKNKEVEVFVLMSLFPGSVKPKYKAISSEEYKQIENSSPSKTAPFRIVRLDNGKYILEQYNYKIEDNDMEGFQFVAGEIPQEAIAEVMVPRIQEVVEGYAD